MFSKKFLQEGFLSFRAAPDKNGIGFLELVFVEHPEIMDVHGSRFSVDKRYDAFDFTEPCFFRFLQSGQDIGCHSDAGRLDQEQFRRCSGGDSPYRIPEISAKTAADASCRQFIQRKRFAFHQSAVHIDLAEIILDQCQFPPHRIVINQHFDPRRLAGSEEPADD